MAVFDLRVISPQWLRGPYRSAQEEECYLQPLSLCEGKRSPAVALVN